MFETGSFSITAASSQVQAQSMHKPGGCLLFLQGGIKGRIVESGTDSHGRWAYTKYRRNIGPPITVIVTYQVVDTDPRRSGPTTYATQLYAAYIGENRYRPERLRHHHAHDLVAFVKSCQSKGESVIIAGDFNEVMGETDRGLTKLHSECSLIDAVLDKHGATEFTTYQRGQSIIDYIMVDPHIYSCI